MPTGYPLLTCKRCPKTRDEAGGLTRSGYCIDCANELKMLNLVQLKLHRGPYFEHWRRRCLAAFGGVPIEDRSAEA